MKTFLLMEFSESISRWLRMTLLALLILSIGATIGACIHGFIVEARLAERTLLVPPTEAIR